MYCKIIFICVIFNSFSSLVWQLTNWHYADATITTPLDKWLICLTKLSFVFMNMWLCLSKYIYAICLLVNGRAGRRRPECFRILSQRVFIRSLSNLVNMLVGIISRPSSITSLIPTGIPELWPSHCPILGFPLSESKNFHPVLIKLGEYVGRHNISTKFYNQPNPPGTSELWPLYCPKLGFMLSKSKSFHPVFIKLGKYVGGHIISTKFYNQPYPLGSPELWPFNCPKLGFLLPKSKSFRSVLIKLGKYVGGPNILTKFHKQPNHPLHSWIMVLELSLPLNLPQIRRAYFVSVRHTC